MAPSKVKSDAYKQAGVDIDLATRLLRKVKRKIDRATRPEMITPIGGFGGLFQVDFKKYRQPVLVSSIDGVGTKLMVARLMEKYYTIGYDIVNHCVNDIAVQGAEPLFFLDYVGIGKLRSPLYEEVLSGIADACIEAGCALLGGETAEMPGMYGDDFDLVGIVTGVVEKDRLITGRKIRPGDVAVGLASNGLHTNGYSLARHILFEKMGCDVDTELRELGGTVGEALLKPHISYWPAIRKALAEGVGIHGIAHITGGGLYENVPRVLPGSVGVVFRKDVLPVPPIVKLIVEEGNISEDEAYRVFNMGVGMVWFVGRKSADAALAACRSCGYTAEIIGEAVKGGRNVRIE